ncbi:hypothetical protein [Paraburkholderia sp. RL17-381-BIF-C]|uniref:hypothetical protein n=1 Tax=Paraburkholderia sp. RL17-381-BIF-C TaxID=3031635 RepID=UPI0038BCB10A
MTDMTRRRQRLANKVGLSRIVIQDSNSHKTPQRDIVVRNWWPADRQMTGMTAQAPTIRLPISSSAAHFSTCGPLPCALFDPASVSKLARSVRFIAPRIEGQVIIIEKTAVLFPDKITRISGQAMRLFNHPSIFSGTVARCAVSVCIDRKGRRFQRLVSPAR